MKKIILPLLIFLLCITVGATTPFEKTKTYKGFDDVKQDAWYYDSVKEAYELSLMNGTGDTTFDPDRNIKISECIVLAARLHSIYTNTPIVQDGPTSHWSDIYISYAIDNGIISGKQFQNYQKPILMHEAITVLAKALPDEFFPEINDVFSIPDVTSSFDYFSDVVKFYNAGILSGVDKYGFLQPCSYLTRSRACAMVSRIAIPENRLTLSVSPLEEKYSLSQVYDIINPITIDTELDNINVMTIGSYSFSLADYRNCYADFYKKYGNDTTTAVSSKLDVTEYLKSFAGIKMVADKFDVSISSNQLIDLLEKYYYSRVYYGSSYESLLEQNNTTDKSNLSNSVLSLFYTQAFIDVFGKNAVLGFTNQDVLTLAKDYICAKHILISNETDNALELANQVLDLANNGADFDELISKYGQDPGMNSSPNGYYFTKGMMVKEFEDAAYALSEGQISDIVKTDYGYHIIKRMQFDDNAFLKTNEAVQLAYNLNIQKGISYFESLTSDIQVVYSPDFERLVATID